MTQSKNGHKDACPVCELADIDESVKKFEGVCENCGFVIQKDSDSVSLDWKVTDGAFTQAEQTSWSAEYRVRNATEQQLAQAFEVLEEIDEQLSLTETVWEQSIDIYCDAFRGKITDGRDTASLVAACVCLASRQIEEPIPLNLLEGFRPVHQNKFYRSHLALCDELGIKTETPNPSKYTHFLQSWFNLSDADRRDIERFLSSVEEKQAFVGKDPSGIAAAGVYLNQEDSTQQDVAEAVGISEETVRQRVKQLRRIGGHV